MKKIVTLLMVFVLVFSLAACSSDNTDTEKDNDTKVENSADSEKEPEATKAPEKILDSKFFGEWKVAAPEDGKDYVTIEINDVKYVTINGNKCEYRISAYSTDTDPQLLIELADGNGYQLSIYGSSEPANMFAVTATFDDNGVHTGDESVQYTK